MNQAELKSIAQQLLANHKGILAADESTSTIKKRFDTINLESTEASRRDYREMLFTTPGCEKYISGVILYDETLRQSSRQGVALSKVLQDRGIIPGIKVDTGAQKLPAADGEQMTEGLDGLRGRLAEYHELGARFAKWRAVINIGQNLPSDYCLQVNAHALARYAALCQEAGIVPIVEPEVIMDGSHSLEQCYDATERALKALFSELSKQRVFLEGILLKPNMVISGTKNSKQASVKEVADATLLCFRRNVPAAVPGIVFLSGGQSDELATAHLDAMNRDKAPRPWLLSFSYGRALQAPAIKAWGGKEENWDAGQKAFLHRAKMNSAACGGQYTEAMESDRP